MSEQTKFVTYPDGSINMNYYLARGRDARSEEAHRQMHSVATRFRAATAFIAAGLSNIVDRIEIPFRHRAASQK